MKTVKFMFFPSKYFQTELFMKIYEGGGGSID